jgi:hypothetical protein
MRVAALGLSTPGTSAPKTVRGVRLSRLTPAQSIGTVRRWVSPQKRPGPGPLCAEEAGARWYEERQPKALTVFQFTDRTTFTAALVFVRDGL